MFHPKYKRHYVLIRFFKPDWPRFFEFFRIGLPIGAIQIAEVGLFGFAVLMMGWISTEAVAAHAIAVQCASISFMVPLGLSQAATIRVGLAQGARDPARVGRAGWASLVMTLMFMALTCALFVFAPHVLTGVFLDASRPENQQTIALAVSYLTVAGLFQFFDGTQVAMASNLRGLSDTRVPMMVALIGYWVGRAVDRLFVRVRFRLGRGRHLDRLGGRARLCRRRPVDPLGQSRTARSRRRAAPDRLGHRAQKRRPVLRNYDAPDSAAKRFNLNARRSMALAGLPSDRPLQRAAAYWPDRFPLDDQMQEKAPPFSGDAFPGSQENTQTRDMGSAVIPVARHPLPNALPPFLVHLVVSPAGMKLAIRLIVLG